MAIFAIHSWALIEDFLELHNDKKGITLETAAVQGLLSIIIVKIYPGPNVSGYRKSSTAVMYLAAYAYIRYKRINPLNTTKCKKSGVGYNYFYQFCAYRQFLAIRIGSFILHC